ncbi:MAG: PAS domain-containing sensor histidine kinase [Chitinophagaceae bacterium]|nr:MAG: PAS domain-containing sensor histidine kinase [Chitinophagaceae bacterium]
MLATYMLTGQLHTAIQHANIFQTMFEELPVGVALTDQNGRIIYSNKKFSIITGLGRDVLKSNPIDDIVGTDEHGKSVTRLFKESNKQQLDFCNWQLMRGDEKIPVALTINKLSQFLCFTATDNSAHLETLTQNNRELDRSNQELSQYAYVASHDLQEPLRKIRIFSDILGSNSKIPAKDKFIVQKISTAAERMNLLITDLLNYSKLVKQDSEYEAVDLQQVLEDVLVDFEVTIQERQASIQCCDLPSIHAVRLQMNQLFFNLLSNSLKFVKAGTRPRISIEAIPISHEDAGKYLRKTQAFSNYYDIVVTDNGIGFETQFSEQIFEVFKRLHGRDVYPGSGIGLSLCRRIAENHNGYLFAESKVGQGTKFHLIVPDKQQQTPSLTE